jgi:hypothetical protein
MVVLAKLSIHLHMHVFDRHDLLKAGLVSINTRRSACSALTALPASSNSGRSSLYFQIATSAFGDGLVVTMACIAVHSELTFCAGSFDSSSWCLASAVAVTVVVVVVLMIDNTLLATIVRGCHGVYPCRFSSIPFKLHYDDEPPTPSMSWRGVLTVPISTV